tara:strand:- start:241 stop:429 length:189 start_codon:yes stop_codon:yes gene_type:complete
MKYVNYFILLVFSLEAISVLIGYGTHYEHFKFGLMAMLIFINLSFKTFKRNINLAKIVKKIS